MAKGGRSLLMGLVTDRGEWKPLLDALEAEGINGSALTVQQEQTWDRERRHLLDTAEIEVEIRDARTWAMDEAARAALEWKLREKVPPQWNAPGLRFLWRKPMDPEWGNAWTFVSDKLWRDFRRRRIAPDAFAEALDRLDELNDRVWDEAEDHRPLLPLLDEVLADARRRPPPPREIPPLRPGEIGTDEVIALLRRIANRSSVPRIFFPATGNWRNLWHSVGTFEIEGWRVDAVKRTHGMKAVQSVTAPDGRTADYKDFERREGNPFNLLADEEQDAVCHVLENS